MFRTRVFKPLLTAAVACSAVLAPVPVLAEGEMPSPIKASFGLGVLEVGIELLSELPENCAKEPKNCSEKTLNQALDKIYKDNPLLKPMDAPDARKELIELLQYLANTAKPAQLKKLKTASAEYHKTLQEFRMQVVGDQSEAIAKLFTGAQDRARISSVKANMHTLQTIVETYGVDWAGVYAPDLLTLVREAKKSGVEYWKDFTNPFTGKSGAGKAGSVTDYRSYQNSSDHKSFAGLVLYEPLPEKGRKEIVSYKIYGCDANGELIQDKGQLFYLTNI